MARSVARLGTTDSWRARRLSRGLAARSKTLRSPCTALRPDLCVAKTCREGTEFPSELRRRFRALISGRMTAPGSVRVLQRAASDRSRDPVSGCFRRLRTKLTQRPVSTLFELAWGLLRCVGRPPEGNIDLSSDAAKCASYSQHNA